MIEISAKLVGGSIYLPGDRVVCRIHVKHLNNPDNNNKKPEIIAWASAQIHCLCSTNSKVAIFPKSSSTDVVATFSDTSFSPYNQEFLGQIVLSTNPKILFCDLHLASGSSSTFVYSECLPNEAPPTFRGQLVKYVYKITIGVQRLNNPIKLLRVPFRVLAFTGFSDCNNCEDSEDLSPNNPFLEINDKEQELDAAFKLMQNITARRNPNFYNITNTRGKVGRFCIFKQSYRLGEDIVGTFDFSTSTVPCIELTVTLQCEEKISEEHKRLCKREMANQSLSKYHEVCFNMKYSQLILPIPMHVTPAFTTNIVSLVWKLHFEFVTSQSSLSDVPIINDTWKAPSSVNIETMVWDLPIQIYPTIPAPDSCPNTNYNLFF